MKLMDRILRKMNFEENRRREKIDQETTGGLLR